LIDGRPLRNLRHGRCIEEVRLISSGAGAVPFRHRDEAKRAEMGGRREPKAGDIYN
jgi:hypothetical protein